LQIFGLQVQNDAFEVQNLFRISSAVEQWTVNPLVASSNLASGVKALEGEILQAPFSLAATNKSSADFGI
jgi:hypothetical protein